MSLQDRVIRTIEKNLEGKERSTITPATDLRHDLGVDSFAMLIIINALEDEFSITIEEKDFIGIAHVADIVERLQQHYPDLKEP